VRLWLGLLYVVDFAVELYAQWRANRATRVKDKQLEAAARSSLTRGDTLKRLREGSF
jgi:hypothetical protein